MKLLQKVIVKVMARHLCVMIGVISLVAMAYAQPIDLDKVNQIKAAYIYHMAQLTTWPVDELDEMEALRVVFVGQETDALANILSEKTNSLLVQGHRLEVSYVPPSLVHAEPPLAFQNKIKDAHIVYVSEESIEPTLSLCKRYEMRPLLIAGDGRDIPHAGGMVGFYIDDQRVRIKVNLERVESSELRMSAEFLQHVTLVTPDKKGR